MSSTGHPAVVAVSHLPAAWAEELIRVQVLAARLAGEQMGGPTLERLLESVGRACLPAKPGWDRKAAAHAEIFACWPAWRAAR